MVTVIDCSTYLQHLFSKKGATVKDSPELFYPTTSKEQTTTPHSKLLEALKGNPSIAIDYEDLLVETTSGVSELLMEQTEVADVILLNKCDLLERSDDDNTNELQDIRQIVQALNPRATILQTVYSQVDSILQVLGAAQGMGVVDAGIVDDHKDSVLAVMEQQKQTKEAEEHHHPKESSGADLTEPALHDDHDHHNKASSSSSCTDPTHDHHHHHESSSTCTDPSCTDPSHDDHHHHHESSSTCTDPSCTDPSHDHHHHHESSSTCTDPNCTDPTHDHKLRDHSKGYHTDISTFVYKSRRPFHPQRLMKALQLLPVVRGIPSVVVENFGDNNQNVADKTAASAFQSVLRSKGFSWIANSHIAALYWSQAGSSFEMSCLGRWWATLPRSEWPEEAVDTILSDFDDASYNDSDKSPQISAVGDRRQELVFIGFFGSGAVADRTKNIICQTLDDCVLSDEEWVKYQNNCGSEEDLQKAFGLLPLEIRILSF
jgi:G3E family GTPase